MISRRALLGASALMACTSPSFGNQTYGAGKEYLAVSYTHLTLPTKA